MTFAIDHMIACQDALLAAIDARDVEGIERASVALSSATQALQQPGAWETTPATQARFDHALKQSKAAAMRVNTLSHWTRQKIDQLRELRSGNAIHTYAHWFKNGAKRPA